MIEIARVQSQNALESEGGMQASWRGVVVLLFVM
jgi:hypothetical protein